MRAATYARFSTELQSEASIADQERVCTRLAEREGFSVVARFSDAAISGGTSTRPGYQSLLAAARRREFDVIIAEDSSRLWRELSEQWRALKELQDLGIYVLGHGIDTRREESKILLAVTGASAEAYRDEIARRTRRGLEGRAVAGKPTGGKAYGYTAARDSGTGQVEINEAEAAIVRRIFEMYADGLSPRAIAMQLNDDGIASPGSSWNRKVRRTSGWLASAIGGDPVRGTGILNNGRYVGRIRWGRSQWTRGASDSSKRRMRMNAKPMHEAQDERLRIVPQILWDRVKVRQAQQQATLGARVKDALRKPGAGRPGRYLLSGLLRCGLCDARFTLINDRSYACSSRVNGALCANRLSVRRTLVESRVLDAIRTDLRDPEIIDEIERRVTRALAAKPKPANTARIQQLQKEVANLTDAIAGGLLKASPALAARLAAAESELARLMAESKRKAPVVGRILPGIRERYLALVDRLDQPLGRNPDRARSALADVIGSRITLQPDESGRFLWADFGMEAAPLLAAVGAAEIVVAGVGFEPTTFGL